LLGHIAGKLSDGFVKRSVETATAPKEVGETVVVVGGVRCFEGIAIAAVELAVSLAAEAVQLPDELPMRERGFLYNGGG
jgi:hypothetical protein